MPAASSMLLSAWMPVPDAPTMPTGPRSSTFEKPSPTPSISAVPQSGPIMSRPSSSALRFSASSDSTGTPSEKQNTCSPASRACAHSYAPCCPGTEITARFSSGRARAAAPIDRGASCADPPVPAPAAFRSRSSMASSAACAAASSAARTASTRSFGPRSSCASRSKPWRSSSSTLSGVAFTAEASSTPGRDAASWEATMSETESK